MRLYYTVTLFFILMFTTGCTVTPKYHVTIDAITAPNVTIQPSTYIIKPLDPNQKADDLKFQRYATVLDQVLQSKGYQKALNETSKQEIDFNYGIDKVSEERETYIEPDMSMSVGFGFPFGGYSPFYHPIYYGNSFYGGGYYRRSTTHTYYNRYVSILAKDSSSSKELWRVDVSSIGESKNLKRIIPLLIKSAQPYLGLSTDEPIELVVKDKAKKKR